MNTDKVIELGKVSEETQGHGDLMETLDGPFTGNGG
jgi:hypothetical protein